VKITNSIYSSSNTATLATIILQQLKHDAPYAWYLRNSASVSPVFKREHLNVLDQQLESHLDCFFISESKKKIVLSMLNLSDWGAVYVMALIAIKTNDVEFMDAALGVIKQQRQSTELRDALSCAEIQFAKPVIKNLLCNKNSLVHAAAIESLSSHDMQLDNETILSFLKKSPDVVISTLKYIGNNKLVYYKENVESLLTHYDEAVCFQAAFSGSLLGLPRAISVLQNYCFSETQFVRNALSLYYDVVAKSAIWVAVEKIQKSSISPRIKAYNLAMAGLPDYVSTLIEWMNDPEYAPIAGEAFSFITGVDIEEDDLSIINVELCESREAPLAEKRKKDPWTQAYEEDLPWPDPELVSIWWQNNKNNFQNGSRYLAGMTLDVDNLHTILKQGTQTQRHSASLILAVNKPDSKVIDVTEFYSG